MADVENQLIQRVNERPVPMIEESYSYSASGLGFSVAKLDSLQIAASLKDNELLFRRLRLEAARNFGGFGNGLNGMRRTGEDEYNAQRRYIYPVVRPAGSSRQPY